MQPHVYRAVIPGVETLKPGTDLPRHRHSAGYATIVLKGSFVEASFAGRFRVEPGDVLLHGAFDCHANWMASARGVQLLRLPWSDPLDGCFCVRDPDWLARLCEQDPLEAAEELHRLLQVVRQRGALDWPSQLAGALSSAPSLSLRQWAASRHFSPEALSRGFRRAFGVSPRQFRLETRARRAWTRVLTRARRSQR